MQAMRKNFVVGLYLTLGLTISSLSFADQKNSIEDLISTQDLNQAIKDLDQIDLNDLDLDGIINDPRIQKSIQNVQDGKATLNLEQINDLDLNNVQNLEIDDLIKDPDLKQLAQEQVKEIEKQTNDQDLLNFTKNCENSLTFKGSPYEKASCRVDQKTLKIELVPQIDYEKNIQNANLNSIDQSMCLLFGNLTKIDYIDYVFLDHNLKVINKHIISRNNCSPKKSK